MILLAAALYLPCIFIGDEVAQRVAHYKPECAVAARPDATSLTMLNFKPANKYSHVYIAVGTSGYLNPNMGKNLFTLRKRYKGMPVTWIAPRNTRGQQIVFETATYFHDNVVYLSRVRPKGIVRDKDYKKIAQSL